jgi:hypothetical protein
MSTLYSTKEDLCEKSAKIGILGQEKGNVSSVAPKST